MSLEKEKLATPLAYLIALFMTFVIGGFLIFIFIGKNPIVAYREFFAQSFFSSYGILEVMAKATPIIIAGSGMIIAFRCGLWNLGAEGQMAIVAILSIVFLLWPDHPAFVIARPNPALW